MQSSSADTNFTFGDNVVAVAESGNQSSPATGDSGAASGTWQNAPSRRSKSSASNRSMGRTSRRSTPHGGHRTPRRTTTRSQAHLDHIRTDLRGPGILRVREKQMDPSIFLLNKQLVRNCWNFRENIMKNCCLIKCLGTGFACWNLKWCLEIESLVTLKSNSQTISEDTTRQ